jgi:hypothetical protein
MNGRKRNELSRLKRMQKTQQQQQKDTIQSCLLFYELQDGEERTGEERRAEERRWDELDEWFYESKGRAGQSCAVLCCK